MGGWDGVVSVAGVVSGWIGGDQGAGEVDKTVFSGFALKRGFVVNVGFFVWRGLWSSKPSPHYKWMTVRLLFGGTVPFDLISRTQGFSVFCDIMRHGICGPVLTPCPCLLSLPKGLPGLSHTLKTHTPVTPCTLWCLSVLW